MAKDWRVPGDNDKDDCKTPLVPPTNIIETTAIPASRAPGPQTSPQVPQTSPSMQPASSIPTRSRLAPGQTTPSIKTPTILTKSTGPPGPTEASTLSSAVTKGPPGITKTTGGLPTKATSPGVSLETATKATSPLGTESPSLIGSASTAILMSTSFPRGTAGVTSAKVSGSTLQPSGPEGIVETPSTATRSTPQPTGPQGATGKTVSPLLTSGPGKTETQKTATTLKPVETFPTKSTSLGVGLSPGSTTQQTSPKISEIPTLSGSASTVITTTSFPGTEGKVSTPSTATGSTLTPAESKATPGAQSTISSSQPAVTTEKYTGPLTEPITGAEKPTSQSRSTTLPPGATSPGKLTKSYSPSGTGSTTEKTSPKITTPPPGITLRTQPSTSGGTAFSGSTIEQSTPQVPPTTPSGFKATTITNTTPSPSPGTETSSIGLPSATPFSSTSRGVTEFIQTTPSIGPTTATQGTTEITLPFGSAVSTAKLASQTTPTNESTQAPRFTTPSFEYSTTAPIPCRKDSLCALLTSTDSPFAECHDFVSPSNFFSSCASDSCDLVDPKVECESLESYAAACAQEGVCIDWRDYTEICVIDCPSDKVYKACVPAEPPTCEDDELLDLLSLVDLLLNVTTEGCYCPEGTKLFNKDSDVCVKTCGCLDPENKPREFNETFEFNCQECTCHKSKTVTCKPKQCPKPETTTCEHPGYVLVNETSQSDPCCSELVCQCQISNCKVPNMKCQVGFMPVLNIPKGICCPDYVCVPKKVCVSDDIEYKNGSLVPGKACEECVCTDESDSFSGGLLAINCTIPPCNKTCDVGSEYVMKKTDQCCGKCEPTHCVLIENGITELLIEGESWSPPTNKCEIHVCVKTEDKLVTLTSTVPCPHLNESECLPHTIQTLANGCCKTCEVKEKACKKVSSKTKITHNGCTSVESVDLASCEGSCNTFSKYSQAAESMEHSCACCKELTSSNRTVDLLCADGNTVPLTYMYVEECGCDPTECVKDEPAPSRRKRGLTDF